MISCRNTDPFSENYISDYRNHNIFTRLYAARRATPTEFPDPAAFPEALCRHRDSKKAGCDFDLLQGPFQLRLVGSAECVRRNSVGKRDSRVQIA